jgi:hypothetical protein
MQPDLSVSVIAEADRDIKNRIIDWRKSLDDFEYEIIVIDRGTEHRQWLAQQGDVQLITIRDQRSLTNLLYSIARYGNKLYFKQDEWSYIYRDILRPVQIENTKEALLTPTIEEQRIMHISNFPRNTRGITEALGLFGEVTTFDWYKILNDTNRENMNLALKRQAIRFRPHIIFMEECFTGDVLPDTIKEIKHLMRVGVANWCGDILSYIPESIIAMGTVDFLKT